MYGRRSEYHESFFKKSVDYVPYIFYFPYMQEGKPNGTEEKRNVISVSKTVHARLKKKALNEDIKLQVLAERMSRQFLGIPQLKRQQPAAKRR